MADPNTPETQHGNRSETYTSPGMKNVTLNYVLYLVGFVIGFTPIVGLIFAYMSRGLASSAVDSHYTYQIRTFWIGLIATLISAVLTLVLVGFLLLFGVAIWMIIRCVKGLMAASRNQPIEDPQTYLF